MNSCKWLKKYKENTGKFSPICGLNNCGCDCNGDTHLCSFPDERAEQLKSEAVDFKTDAEREEGIRWIKKY